MGSQQQFLEPHILSFVGRPPLILGGNPATGGACIGCYSHSSYYGAVPSEVLQKVLGVDILDKNGKVIQNPEYREYVNKWGVPEKDSNGQNVNQSAPKIMIRDAKGNTHLIDQQGKTTILNKNGKVVEKEAVTKFKVDTNGNRYIEMDGKRYHANPY